MTPETTGHRIVREWCADPDDRSVAEALAERIDAALAEAQRDTERLDWLDKHPVDIEWDIAGWRTSNCVDYRIRPAIDAARAKAGEST
jgi:hypothetical protein